MSTNGIEILIVEDNPYDLELATHALRKHNLANEIHVARDGVEALDFVLGTGAYADRATARKPSVILLDLKLPVLDGLDVLRQLKSDPLTRGIPVVMLTSSREEQDIVESYQLGVNSYIVKPVDFEQFSEAVRQIGLYWLLMNQPPSLPIPAPVS